MTASLAFLFTFAGLTGLWLTLIAYSHCKAMAGRRAMIPAMMSCAGWSVLGLMALLQNHIDTDGLLLLLCYTMAAILILIYDQRGKHEAV